MFKKIIFFLIFIFLHQGLIAKELCLKKLIQWDKCSGLVSSAKLGEVKFMKSSPPEDKKACNIWTGYIEVQCTEKGWSINKNNSKCQLECICCY